MNEKEKLELNERFDKFILHNYSLTKDKKLLESVIKNFLINEIELAEERAIDKLYNYFRNNDPVIANEINEALVELEAEVGK